MPAGSPGWATAKRGTQGAASRPGGPVGREVVLPDGRIWDGLRGLRKDNTGYDLKQLFIGGEGTLGIITAATVKLFPKPRETDTAFLALNKVEDVMDLFARARAATADQLTAF